MLIALLHSICVFPPPPKELVFQQVRWLEGNPHPTLFGIYTQHSGLCVTINLREMISSSTFHPSFLKWQIKEVS